MTNVASDIEKSNSETEDRLAEKLINQLNQLGQPEDWKRNRPDGGQVEERENGSRAFRWGSVQCSKSL